MTTKEEFKYLEWASNRDKFNKAELSEYFNLDAEKSDRVLIILKPLDQKARLIDFHPNSTSFSDSQSYYLTPKGRQRLSELKSQSPWRQLKISLIGAVIFAVLVYLIKRAIPYISKLWYLLNF